MTMGEGRWAAATANMAHGLPLKPKELRNVFAAYITARQHYKANGRLKSYRDMAATIDSEHRVADSPVRFLEAGAGLVPGSPTNASEDS